MNTVQEFLQEARHDRRLRRTTHDYISDMIEFYGREKVFEGIYGMEKQMEAIILLPRALHVYGTAPPAAGGTAGIRQVDDRRSSQAQARGVLTHCRRSRVRHCGVPVPSAPVRRRPPGCARRWRRTLARR